MSTRIKLDLSNAQKIQIIEDYFGEEYDASEITNIILKLTASNSPRTITGLCRKTPILAILKESMTEREALGVVRYVNSKWFINPTAKVVAMMFIMDDIYIHTGIPNGMKHKDIAEQVILLNDPDSDGRRYTVPAYIIRILEKLATKEDPDPDVLNIINIYKLGLD